MSDDILSANTVGKEGIVTFYASVFGNTDAMGEIVGPKAFDRWFTIFKGRENAVLPVIWSHEFKQADNVIGYARAEDIVIDDHGLKVTAHLDLDNEVARQVMRQVKTGAINQSSFSYDVKRQHFGPKGVTVLDELHVMEVSLCLLGANPLTEVLSSSVKAHQKSAEQISDKVYRGRIELTLKQAVLVNRPLPPLVKAEAQRLGIPISDEAELAEIDASLPRCRRGHYCPPPKVHLNQTNRATRCSTCDTWIVWAPKSITDAQVRNQIERLEVDRAEKLYDRKQLAARTQADAKKFLREMGSPLEPTEEDLVHQLRQIEAVIDSKKTESEAAIEKMETALRRRAAGW